MEDMFIDMVNSDGIYDFVFKIVFLFGDGGNVLFVMFDLFVSGDEVVDEGEDGYDDVFGDGDNVGVGDFGDGDIVVGFVGGIEVDVVGINIGGDGNFKVFGFGEVFGGEVVGVEVGWMVS